LTSLPSTAPLSAASTCALASAFGHTSAPLDSCPVSRR
jgi:hypothetical protein